MKIWYIKRKVQFLKNEKSLTACNLQPLKAHGQVVPFWSLQSHTVWSQEVMGMAGLLELKNLSSRCQVYKVNWPKRQLFCKGQSTVCMYLYIQGWAEVSDRFCTAITGLWVIWEIIFLVKKVFFDIQDYKKFTFLQYICHQPPPQPVAFKHPKF